MTRAVHLALVGLVGALAACGGPGASSPTRAHADLVGPLAQAFKYEATGESATAEAEYLKVALAAADAADEGWNVPVAAAALDALVWRSVTGLANVASDTALAFRVDVHETDAIARALEQARARADDPFLPGLFASALEALAEHRGDAATAAKYRHLAGCALEAAVAGPVAWTSVTGVSEPDVLDAFDARMPAEVRTPGAFAVKLPALVVRGRGCELDLLASTPVEGVRDAVVDVDVSEAGRIGVALHAWGAAELRAGGRVVLERPYELGGGETVQFARVEAKAGKLRLVARVGTTEGATSVEIDAWDAHGRPLPMHAPAPGSAADVRAGASEPVRFASPKTDPERLAFALGALALDDKRTAERALEEVPGRADAPPELVLAYARAVDSALDLGVHRAERARAAYERVLEAWPGAWEAVLAHAVLAGERRAQSEAKIETLRDLDALREKASPSGAALLDAFDAATSGQEHLFDRAAAAYERAKKGLAGTSLLYDVGDSAFARSDRDVAAYRCAPARPDGRDALDCHGALVSAGDRPGAARELDRVREVLGAPSRFLDLSLEDALVRGDLAAANRAFGAMLPAERTLSALSALDRSPDARAHVLRMASTALDAPGPLPGILRELGDDPFAAFDGVAERLTAEDRAHPILPNAATAVLAHVERYDVDASGLVHAVLFDVRRVSGTTDVEENAQADLPIIYGRHVMRALRRRILKKDGRILEPDRTPMASQSHADLSQLEQGDTVEGLYESWALPGETGDVGIDTPDLLPERVAVHDATIEVRLPEALRVSLWSHVTLGAAAESHEGGARVLRWKLVDQPGRRIEGGIPKMDRSVGVSLATAEWDDVARALRETIASLDEHDPEIGAWARDAAKGAAGAGAGGQRALVEAVVVAAGRAVKEAQAGTLSDIGIGRAIGPQLTTARTILADHEGSRSWLVVRALRELGVHADVVIAENEPYSADPKFPPHFGRFMHPLVLAHLSDGGVWVDADIPGPPLPAGRVSPELRGRSALWPDGRIAPLPAAGEDDELDAVSIDLTLDAQGSARGTFAVSLRGRDAQEIAEDLLRVVGEERQRALRGVVLAWVPFANVDDVVLSSSEGSWQVDVRAAITVSGYAQAQGTTPQKRVWVLPGLDTMHWVFPRPHVSTLGATFARQGARENALAVSSAVQYQVHRRVVLPPGSQIVRTPGPFELKTGHLEARRRIAVNAAKASLEDDFLLEVPTGTIPASGYGDFVSDAHKTDDAFLGSSWVKPAP